LKYKVEFKSSAEKDIKAIPQKIAVSITKKIIELENGLTGDIKKLTNFTPEYRLRVGNYRILFEVKDDKVLIFLILHRQEAYK